MPVSEPEAMLHYAIEDHDDYVQVRGVRREELVSALKLLSRVRLLQADQATLKREALVQALMASEISLVPSATLAQARRLAVARDALLATPVFTHETLQELRGDANASATRTWLSRARGRYALFTVTHAGRTLIPAFQLDEVGEPRPELQPLISALVQHDVDPWSAWTWLTKPTSYLSGETPSDVAASQPERALRAVTRFVAPRSG